MPDSPLLLLLPLWKPGGKVEVETSRVVYTTPLELVAVMNFVIVVFCSSCDDVDCPGDGVVPGVSPVDEGVDCVVLGGDWVAEEELESGDGVDVVLSSGFGDVVEEEVVEGVVSGGGVDVGVVEGEGPLVDVSLLAAFEFPSLSCLR